MEKYDTVNYNVRLAIDGGHINRKCRNKQQVMEIAKSEGLLLNEKLTKNEMIKQIIYNRWDKQ